MHNRFMDINKMLQITRGDDNMGVRLPDSDYQDAGYYVLISDIPDYDEVTQYLTYTYSINNIERTCEKVFTILEKNIQLVKDEKIETSWTKYNNQNEDMLNTIDGTANADKSDLETLNQRSNGIVAGGGVLTPEEDSQYNDFNTYLNTVQANKNVAIQIETDIQSLTDVDDIGLYDIDSQPWVDTPFSTREERGNLIDELKAQSTIPGSNFSESDSDVMNNFVTSNITYASLTGIYGIMPSGRDLYDSLGESVGQEINVMITKHIQGRTYFDTDTQLFVVK